MCVRRLVPDATLGHLGADEEGEQADGDDEDDAEDDHDTGVFGGPVLALGQHVDGFSGGALVEVEGRHCLRCVRCVREWWVCCTVCRVDLRCGVCCVVLCGEEMEIKRSNPFGTTCWR